MVTLTDEPDRFFPWARNKAAVEVDVIYRVLRGTNLCLSIDPVILATSFEQTVPTLQAILELLCEAGGGCTVDDVVIEARGDG